MKQHRIGPGLSHWRTSTATPLPHLQALLSILVWVLCLEYAAAARTHGSSRSTGQPGTHRLATAVIGADGVKHHLDHVGAPIQQFTNHSVMVEAEAPLMPFLTFEGHQEPHIVREQQRLSSLGRGHWERHGTSLYQQPAAAGFMPRMLGYSKAGGLVLKAAALVAFLAAVSWGCFKTLDGGTGKPAVQQERTGLLDNARGIGNFCVIFGHFVFYNHVGEFTGQTSLLTGAEGTLHVINSAMAPLKLPLLSFISGLCSQGEPTGSRLQRFFIFLVAPTCLWVFFAKPVIFDTLYTGNFSSSWERFLEAVQLGAFHNEWYLQALILWRGSVYLIWKNLRPSVALVGMLAASFVGGYTTFGTGPASNLKIDETLGFLPYFALGFVFPHQRVLEIAGRPSAWASCLACALILTYSGWFVPHHFAGEFPDGHGSYGAQSDTDVWEAARPGTISYELYWCRRLAKAVIDMGAVLGFLYLVVPRGRFLLSWVGQHTMHSYVWHLLALVWWDRLVAKCSPPVVTSQLGHAAVIALNAAVCLLAQVFFCSPPWRAAFAWCFDPTWLQQLAPSVVSTQSQNTSAEREKQKQQETTPCLDSKIPSSPEELKKGHESSVDSTSEGSLEDHRSESTAQLSECRASSTDMRKKPFKANVTLPTMEESKSFAKWVLPCFVIAVFFPLIAFFWIGPKRVVDGFLWFPLPVYIFMMCLGLPRRIFLHGFWLWRFQETHQPKPQQQSSTVPARSDAPLLHVCVVVEYREPLEVLTRTVSSIACQTNLNRRPVLVLATEARDPERKETCEVLERLCADAVEEFIVTEHTLLPGETVGKHSNENKAVREVWKRYVTERSMSPFHIMVTIVDADSILSSTYLSVLENVYSEMPDGRRLIYNGPLNTYRNLGEAGMLVQAVEIGRCHSDVFHDPVGVFHPQSNYSMTLGLIQEIDYWMPDCISEDMKCHVKALANNFGSQTTVAVPAFICNDTVVQFSDRYVQAKRHQWGSVQEFPWHLKLAYESPLSLKGWWVLVSDEVTRNGSLFKVAGTFSMKIAFFAIVYHLLTRGRTDVIFDPRFIVLASSYIFDVILYWAAEVYLWKTSLSEFPIMWPSLCRQVMLIVLFPLLELVCQTVFAEIATMDCIFHITFRSHHLTYINAPKGSLGR